MLWYRRAEGKGKYRGGGSQLKDRQKCERRARNRVTSFAAGQVLGRDDILRLVTIQ